jgi:hypothetical protein
MSAAAAAILEGMPDPADLHMHEDGGQVAVMAGNRVLACYPAADAGMRNMTVVVLTQLGFAGKDVAAVMGLTPVYVSMLRSRAREEGSAGLVRDRGRPAKLGKAAAAQARRWREQGVSDAEIGRRLCTAPPSAGRSARQCPPVPRGLMGARFRTCWALRPGTRRRASLRPVLRRPQMPAPWRAAQTTM